MSDGVVRGEFWSYYWGQFRGRTGLPVRLWRPFHCATGASLTDWTDFLQSPEADQARFLLDTAMAAWARRPEDDMAGKVRDYLALGHVVLDGNHSKLPELMRFLEDPEMTDDFAAFHERVQNDATACAALDLAAYACGFVSRMMARVSGHGPLPDTVLESLPEIYEYYRDRAEFLGV